MLVLILYIFALVLFLVAALAKPAGVRIDLVALGLAFIAAAFVVSALHGE